MQPFTSARQPQLTYVGNQLKVTRVDPYLQPNI